MSNIHYFQRYAQRENVTTNNTLLLFSRLYRFNHHLFEAFLNDLLSDYVPDISIGVSMEQQKRVEHGRIPDGFIAQDSFKIVIETKQGNAFNFNQLQGHLHAFGEEKTKVLLLLSPEVPNDNVIEQIRSAAKTAFPDVKIVATSFEMIIEKFNEVLDESRHWDMKDLIEEYASYCAETDLLPTWKYIMRARTASYSFDFNLQHNLYYDHISRGYMKHQYFALYKHKAVRAVGKIENIVVANFQDGEVVTAYSDLGKEVTPTEKAKIIAAMHHAKEQFGDDVYQDCRFFMVEEFVRTFYEKVTRFPIQKSKSFDLRKVLNAEKLPSDISEIAEGLMHADKW